MKVVNSNIPEENGKPLFENNNWKEVPKDKVKAFIDNPFASEEGNDDEETRYKRKMVILDNGIVMDLFQIHSIEYEMAFCEKPTAHWKHGFIINKGMQPSTFVNKVDIQSWYSTRELAEEKYELLLEKLEESGFSLIRMTPKLIDNE